LKKKKILFGAVDIGWRIEHYSKFIAKEFPDSLEADSFVKFKLPEAHYKTSYTYHLQYHKYPKLIQWIWSFGFFIFALFRYDIFYFLSGETLLTRKLLPFELKLYRLLGKRIVMHFVGSDIRSPKYLKALEDNISNPNIILPPISEAWQFRIVNAAHKYADNIVVSTPDLLKIIPKAIYLPVFLDFKKFYEETNLLVQKQNGNNSIKILHAPSNPLTKGSKTINAALNKLKDTYPNIEILSPKDKGINTYATTRYELLELMKQADIIIDQILIGWYGLQTVEGLALGKTVICYINTELIHYLRDNIGVVNCNPLAIHEDITKQIKNNITTINIDSQLTCLKNTHSINTYKTEFYNILLK